MQSRERHKKQIGQKKVDSDRKSIENGREFEIFGLARMWKEQIREKGEGMKKNKVISTL